MSWLFSQALVAEYSAGSCSAGEPSAQLSVMPTPQQFWRNDKMMDCSIFSRFGLTFQPLTAEHGAELLTSFLAAFPARTFQPQEKAQESRASVLDCGEKWCASFARYDQDSCLWKTAQLSLLGGLEPFSETWPRWGTMLNGECWARIMLARRTNAIASGFWQTPVSDDAINRKQGKWNSRGEPKLSAQVLNFPTPAASDGSRGGVLTANMTGQSLPQMVNTLERWPTPTVCGNNQAPKAGTTRGTGLATAVKTWPTPRSSCHDMGTLMMSKFSGTQRKAGLPEAQYNPEQAGQLNPPWVEWLMGWPIGWTELKPLATGKCLPPTQKHYASCDKG